MKMKKTAFVTAMFLVSTLLMQQANAQKSTPLRLGFGIDAGSTLKDPTRFVLGADGRLQIPFGNSFSGIVTAGYYHYFKSDKAGEGFGIAPLKAGVKYFPAKNVYIAGEAGVGFGTENGQPTSFVYSPSVGLAFGNGLDLSLKYEDYTHKDYGGYASQLALRIAYGFKL